MTVKDDTRAFLDALQEFREAAERGENDESSRPRPSKTNIARGRWPRILQVQCGTSRQPEDRRARRLRRSQRRLFLAFGEHPDEQSKSLLPQCYRGDFGIS